MKYYCVRGYMGKAIAWFDTKKEAEQKVKELKRKYEFKGYYITTSDTKYEDDYK